MTVPGSDLMPVSEFGSMRDPAEVLPIDDWEPADLGFIIVMPPAQSSESNHTAAGTDRNSAKKTFKGT